MSEKIYIVFQGIKMYVDLKIQFSQLLLVMEIQNAVTVSEWWHPKGCRGGGLAGMTLQEKRNDPCVERALNSSGHQTFML